MAGMDKDAPYTVAEAAKELRTDAQKVYRLIQRGELEVAPVHGNATLITAASVAKLKERGLEDRS